jgi:hypothetical protein
MASHVEGVTKRAVSCFDRYVARFDQVYGLKGKQFDHVSLKRRGPELIYPLGSSEQGVRALPHRRAFGTFARLPIGSFALYLVRLEPWESDFELVATIALGDHRHLSDDALTTAFVDPERRVGLGPWYEVTATFEEPQAMWDHGFYAHRQDPRRARLDRIWRRHGYLAGRAHPRRVGDTLLEGLWERLLSKKTF